MEFRVGLKIYSLAFFLLWASALRAKTRVESIIEEERRREKSFYEQLQARKQNQLEVDKDILKIKSEREQYISAFEKARLNFKRPESFFDLEAYLNFREKKYQNFRMVEKVTRDYIHEQKRIRQYRKQYSKLKKSTEYGLE